MAADHSNHCARGKIVCIGASIVPTGDECGSMTTSYNDHGTHDARRERYLVLSVECDAGVNGEREPKAFSMDKRRVIVDEIIDRWLATDHQYFKVRADDSGTYILRYDANRAIWELTLFDSGRAPEGL